MQEEWRFAHKNRSFSARNSAYCVPYKADECRKTVRPQQNFTI